MTNITGNKNVEVSFAKQTLDISTKATPLVGGKITVASGANPVPYEGGVTFNITPNEGYKISNVEVDGVSKGVITAYTFSDVKATHLIKATFERRKFDITVIKSENGSIDVKTGCNPVTYGESLTFAIVPDANCKIVNVEVDGVSKGVITTYTFNIVKDAHTISATFAKQNSLSINSIDGISIKPVTGGFIVDAPKPCNITLYNVSGITIEKQLNAQGEIYIQTPDRFIGIIRIESGSEVITEKICK